MQLWLANLSGKPREKEYKVNGEIGSGFFLKIFGRFFACNWFVLGHNF